MWASERRCAEAHPTLRGAAGFTLLEVVAAFAILAIGLLSAPAIARIVRSVTLAIRHEEFVQAARARGESDLFVVFSEILPNAGPAIIVEAGLQFTFGILLVIGGFRRWATRHDR